MARWAENDILIAFDSTHAAMAAQKLLQPFGPFVIPTPKTITASCGMTLVVRSENAQVAREELMHCGQIAGLYAVYLGGEIR